MAATPNKSFRSEAAVLTAFAVAAAGALGVLLRYGSDSLVQRAGYPTLISTFVINLVGCFLVGLVATLATERDAISQSLATALMVGFCGGLTTFSAYALQSIQMIQRDQIFLALAYLTLSPIAGFIFVYVGMRAAR